MRWKLIGFLCMVKNWFGLNLKLVWRHWLKAFMLNLKLCAIVSLPFSKGALGITFDLKMFVWMTNLVSKNMKNVHIDTRKCLVSVCSLVYLNYADLYLFVSCEAAVGLLYDFKSCRIRLTNSVQSWKRKLRRCFEEMPQNLKCWWPLQSGSIRHLLPS